MGMHCHNHGHIWRKRHASPFILRDGFTDGLYCAGGGLYTLVFSKPVTFTGHTGVGFRNSRTNGVATSVTSLTSSGSNVIEYTVVWDAADEPTLGDDIVFIYLAAVGDYVDPDGEELPTQIRSIYFCPTAFLASGMSATALSDTRIALEWTLPVDESPLDAYKLYRNSVYVTDIPTGDASYIDADLTQSTRYDYRLDTMFNSQPIGSITAFAITEAELLLPPIQLGELVLPVATVGTPYSFSITNLFIGTVLSYAYATGADANGLILDLDTGMLEGTPTVSGTLSGLSFTASNANGTSNPTNTDDLVINPIALPLVPTVGVLTTLGKTNIMEVVYKNDLTDRTGLELILFTDTSGVDVNSAPADFTRPIGGSYADHTLTDGLWSITGAVASYARVSFPNVSTDYSLPVTGCAIITTGATPRCVAYCANGTAITVTAAGPAYQVEPSLTLTQGAFGTTLEPARQLMLELYCNGSSAERGTNIGIVLVDATGAEISSDGGHAEKVLTDATWVITAGDAAYPVVQSWTASGLDFDPAVDGYAMIAQGTSSIVLHTDLNPGPAVLVADGDTRKVDLTVTT